MRGPVRVVVLLLAWTALTAQTRGKIPPQVPQTYTPKWAVTVTVDPNPATVKRPAVLRASVTPQVTNAWQYEFSMDGNRLTECPTNSPECQWIPATAGPHTVSVVVRLPPAGRRGGGLDALAHRLPFEVQPEPTPPPTTPPVNPDKTPAGVVVPEIVLRLVSPKVVAGQPATFAVSLVNGSPFEYAIDMGDGKPETRTDAEFTFTFERSGDVKVAAGFPAAAPIVHSILELTVEPALPLPPPIAFILRAPAEVTVDSNVFLEIAAADGRPLIEYTLDFGDGRALTQSAAAVVHSYSRPGTYVVSVAPAAGLAGTPATTTIRVVGAFPPPWLYLVLGVVAVVGAVMVGRAVHRHFSVPVATFHPDANFTPGFDPARTGGISLEVHYDSNLAGVHYTPRVRIDREG